MKPIFGGFITPVIPDGDFKRFSYFRNRAYLARKYRNLRWFGADVVGFPYYFITQRDLAGLRAWFTTYSAGLRGTPRHRLRAAALVLIACRPAGGRGRCAWPRVAVKG